jgi:hypothetical protein
VYAEACFIADVVIGFLGVSGNPRYAFLAEVVKSHGQFHYEEARVCPRMAVGPGLANCGATNSNVRGLRWTLVDIQLLLASKSGR